MSTEQASLTNKFRLANHLTQVQESLITAQGTMIYWLDEMVAAIADYDVARGQERMVECRGKVAEYETRISDLEADRTASQLLLMAA